MVDMPQSGWQIDSFSVDGSVQAVADGVKELQRKGLHWSSIADRWLEVRPHAEGMEIIARNRKRDVYRQGTFALYLGTDSITGTIDVVREGDGDDMIGLSQEHVTFTKEGGVIEVGTTYLRWWINSVQTGNKTVRIELEDTSRLMNTLRFKKTFDWLTIEVQGRKILLTATPNTANEKRTFKIELVNGNFTTHLCGEQGG